MKNTYLNILYCYYPCMYNKSKVHIHYLPSHRYIKKIMQYICTV